MGPYSSSLGVAGCKKQHKGLPKHIFYFFFRLSESCSRASHHPELVKRRRR